MAGMYAEGSFQPDNLIGGDAPSLVTESVLLAAGNLSRGAVLGHVKVSVPTTGTVTGTGNGTCTAVTGGPKTVQGSYLITCAIAGLTHGGTFKVTNPNGVLLGFFTMPDGAGGTFDFKSDEINFTLTDGSTNFIIGDYITVAVTEGVPNTGTLTGTGNGTCTLVEGRRELKVGSYLATCTVAAAGGHHGGTFEVTDPDGEVLGTVVIADSAGGTGDFSHDQITFRLTDGSTNFIVGDYFTITVTIHPRQVKLLDKAATDGSSVPYAVLAEDVDASAATKICAAYIKGCFNQRSLTFATGTDIEDVREAMQDLSMVVVPSSAHGTI